MEERNTLALGIVLVTAFLILFVRLGAAPLLDPDEARFARTSVEMMRTRDYVVPTFEGAPRLQKPPLLNWIQASLFRIDGVGPFAARLPAAAATFVTLLLVAWVGWRRFGDEGAAWAAAIFATSPLVVACGRIGTLDALLSVHVMAVVALDMVQPEHSGLQRSAVIGALLGLAFLIKGPVGVVLPLLLMLAGRTACGREVVPSLRTAVTAALAWCAMVLPWGIVFVNRVGGGSVLRLVRRETIDRAIEGTAHVHPWWYFAAAVLVAFLPWGAPLLVGTVRGLARWRDRESPTGPYAAAAFLAGIVFFSLSKGKLVTYILPLAPLAALVVVFELGQELVHPRKRRLGPALVATTLVAVAVGLTAAAAIRLETSARGVAAFGGAAFGAAALVALFGIARRTPRTVYAAAGLATAAVLLAIAVASPPYLAVARSAEPLVVAVPELASSRPVVLVDMHLPSLTFYADRVPEEVTGRELAARLDRADDPLVVMDVADRMSLPPVVRGRLREIARSGKLRVYVDASAEERKRDETDGSLP